MTFCCRSKCTCAATITLDGSHQKMTIISNYFFKKKKMAVN